MDRRTFEELVAAAVDEIPEPFASQLENVELVVEDEPSADQLAETDDEDLLGLYEGVPQTERGEYTWAMPDKITIFRGPITRACSSEREIAEQVKITVVHEIAHHFGISDERLTQLGWD